MDLIHSIIDEGKNGTPETQEIFRKKMDDLIDKHKQMDKQIQEVKKNVDDL